MIFRKALAQNINSAQVEKCRCVGQMRTGFRSRAQPSLCLSGRPVETTSTCGSAAGGCFLADSRADTAVSEQAAPSTTHGRCLCTPKSRHHTELTVCWPQHFYKTKLEAFQPELLASVSSFIRKAPRLTFVLCHFYLTFLLFNILSLAFSHITSVLWKHGFSRQPTYLQS